MDPCPRCHARLVSVPAPAASYPAPSYPPPAPYPQYPQQPIYVQPQVVYGAPVAYMPPPKSKVAAALLCFFLGGLGVHRFYTGQIGHGVALLLQTLILVPITLGLWVFVVLIWCIIDFILILSGGVRTNTAEI